MKTIKIVLIGLGLLLTFLVVKMKIDNNTLSNNVDALLQKSTFNDSLRTLKTDELLLSANQIKKYFPQIESTLKDMDVKIRKLERYSSFSSNSTYQLASKVNDTVYIKETITKEKTIQDTIPVQFTQYTDSWIDFKQAIVADSAYTDILIRDSVSITQSWERPKKFWFIRYGRKRYHQTIKNYNPHSIITHSLNIKKR